MDYFLAPRIRQNSCFTLLVLQIQNFALSFAWFFLSPQNHCVFLRGTPILNPILASKKNSDADALLFFGSPLELSPIKNSFASLDGKHYHPRRPKKNEILSRKQRLWHFLTIRYLVAKEKFCELRYVKHCSKE